MLLLPCRPASVRIYQVGVLCSNLLIMLVAWKIHPRITVGTFSIDWQYWVHRTAICHSLIISRSLICHQIGDLCCAFSVFSSMNAQKKTQAGWNITDRLSSFAEILKIERSATYIFPAFGSNNTFSLYSQVSLMVIGHPHILPFSI